jgi:hypothetical protein
MSFTFELEVEPYELLLSRCDPSSQEYQMLVNACIEERPIKGQRDLLQKVVQILCQRDQAEKLLVLAIAAAPAVADIIRSALEAL